MGVGGFDGQESVPPPQANFVAAPLLKTHSRYLHGTLVTMPRCRVRTRSNIPSSNYFVTWSLIQICEMITGSGGTESVFPLCHPVTINKASKMPVARMKINCFFQWCMVLSEKSPPSMPNMGWNSCNGNYESPCKSFLGCCFHHSEVITSELVLLVADTRVVVALF